jgi:hypothetical protein
MIGVWLFPNPDIVSAKREEIIIDFLCGDNRIGFLAG